MDPAEEDWEGHEEGANEITPGGTFSNAALALPLGRTRGDRRAQVRQGLLQHGTRRQEEVPSDALLGREAVRGGQENRRRARRREPSNITDALLWRPP